MPSKRYPNNDVLKEVILDIIKTNGDDYDSCPHKLYLTVKDELENRGYYVGHINIKRVWRVYKDARGRITARERVYYYNSESKL